VLGYFPAVPSQIWLRDHVVDRHWHATEVHPGRVASHDKNRLRPPLPIGWGEGECRAYGAPTAGPTARRGWRGRRDHHPIPTQPFRAGL